MDKFYYSAHHVTLSNCPCRCCGSLHDCLFIPMDKCQKRLDAYVNLFQRRTKYIETKKSKTIHKQLEEDSRNIEKLILNLSKDGCKNDNNELVFLTSRYSYIKELLEKYWQGDGK